MKCYVLLLSLFLTLSMQAQHPEKSTLIGSPTDTETSANLVADDSGNTYLGGSINDKALVLKQNPLHQTLWCHTITFPPAADHSVVISFLDILADTVFGCGTIGPLSGVGGTFYFKMNAITGAMYWSNYETTSRGYFCSMRYAHGKYFLVGGIEQASNMYCGKVMAVSSQTGNMLWQTPSLKLSAPGDGPSSRTLFTGSTEMLNGQMFITGQYRTGSLPNFPSMPILVGVNESGNFFLARHVPLPFIGNWFDTAYEGGRIEYDADGHILLACFNNGPGSMMNNPDLVLLKLDSLGNTLFSKEYEIVSDGTAFVQGLNETTDSYVLYGGLYTNFIGLYTLKLTKDGEFEKCIGIQKPHIQYSGSAVNAYGNSCFKNGMHYFAATEMTSNDLNINQIIIDEGLNSIEDCSALSELPVIITNLDTQLTPLLQTEIANQFVYQTGDIVEVPELYISCDSMSLELELLSGCTSLITAHTTGFELPTYYWSDGTVSAIPTLSTTSTDTIIVTVMDIRCCQLTDTIVPLPVIPMTMRLPADTTVCLEPGMTFTLTPVVTPPNAPVSYSWNNNSTAPSLLVSGSGTYWVEVSDNCGILLRDSIHISVLRLPRITGLSDTMICEGAFPIYLDATVTAGVTVLWNDGPTTVDRTVSTAGTYTLHVTNFCGNTDTTIQVTQTDLPHASLMTAVDSCLHTGESILLLPTLEHVTDIAWSDETTTAQLSVTQSGIYTVYGSNACGMDSASCSVIVREFPELYLPARLDTCFETGIGFAYTAQGNSGMYTWNSGAQTATELITQEGLYICSLMNQCGSTADSMTVHRMAALDLYVPHDSVQLCAQQISANLLHIETNYDYELFLPWSGQPAGHILNESGWYDIRAFNACGEMWDSVYVDLQDEQALYMPNSFTPNGDQVNDHLEVTGMRVTVNSLRIFNRWGAEICHLEGNSDQEAMPIQVWDGTYENLPCPDGIYLVRIVYADCFGMPTEFTGHVSLLR
jgi:gliding motility-associated-like protein